MPLLLTTHPFPSATFGVWQIAEDEAYFRRDMPLLPEEEAELARYKDIRRLEWLAVRWLLHKLTGLPERLPLGKNAFAKPFFLDRPELHCSLSHSHGVVGALLTDRVCGCDLQVLVNKMPHIANKFLHIEEALFIQQFPTEQQFDLFHIFWTAKESLYKAYGLKELDFRAQIRLEPFPWKDDAARSSGWIRKEGFSQSYQLHFEKVQLPDEGAFVWTTCLEV